MTYRPGTIRTLSGRYVDIFDLHPEDICLADIACGLSKECRYGNQIEKHYSVAQHAWIVSRMVPPEYALEGLHHDDFEAYGGDWPRPIKERWREFIEAENRGMEVIGAVLGLKPDWHEVVKPADDQIGQLERRVFHDGYLADVLQCWSAEEAEVRWLDRHYELGGLDVG